MTTQLIEAYYKAFNARDYDTMLQLLTDDVAHDINQGKRELGRAAFGAFLARMDQCYREQLVDIVIMMDGTGKRASAEFTVLGTYLKADEGLPAARGQAYRLPAGTFFEVKAGKISRVTTYYNLGDWIAQVEKTS